MNNIKETSEIYTIDHFLTDAECEELIAKSEALGYEEAKVNMDGGQRMMKMIRDNERVMYTDLIYAFQLWEKLETLYQANNRQQLRYWSE